MSNDPIDAIMKAAAHEVAKVCNDAAVHGTGFYEVGPDGPRHVPIDEAIRKTFECEKTGCGRLFQCDDDPTNEYGEIVCPRCVENANEAAYDRQQERLMECGASPSLIEQHRAAWRMKHGWR